MKKIFCLVIVLVCVTFTAACSKKEVLNLYNWGEYFDDNTVDGVNLKRKFEKEYNCKINYLQFTSNEMAITKMETESFDIVVPSEYAIEQLALEDKIMEIDWSRVEGYTKDDITTNLKTMLENLKNEENGFDMLKYAVPYFWGSVGILYNPEKVDVNDLETLGWNIFKESKYNVVYYDSSRDGFMPALKELGYSMNTSDTTQVDRAYDWLLDMKNKVNPAFKTDEILSDMPALRYDIALCYSGDAIYTMSLAEEAGNELAYYIPSAGTNVWCDGMVIPKNAKNVDLAYKFISFMCEEENALANSIYAGYSATVNSAYESAVGDLGEFADYSDIYCVSLTGKDEIFRYNKDMKRYMNQKWTELKVE